MYTDMGKTLSRLGSNMVAEDPGIYGTKCSKVLWKGKSDGIFKYSLKFRDKLKDMEAI